MGEKSLQKRKHILEMARKVFVEKGFKLVTMKDIVEACEISRGGLYLYFNNTSEIFLEIMKQEPRGLEDIFSVSITEEATAAEILILFLMEQKKELLCREDTMTQAVYEFYFDNKLLTKDNMLKRRFDSSVKILQKLIETGVENGEFYCEDCEGAARSIMFVLEGLKITAQTIGLTAETLDTELLFILKGLGVDEE